MTRLKAIIEVLNQDKFKPLSDTDPTSGITDIAKENGQRASNYQKHDKNQKAKEFDNNNVSSACNLGNDADRRTNFDSYKNRRTPNSEVFLGVNGVMKVYQDREKYSGIWGENLNSALKLYEGLSQMCNLSEGEKEKSAPVMLEGDPIAYFAKVMKSEDTYDEAVKRLLAWSTNVEQKGRIWYMWQSLCLSEAIKLTPEKSGVDVFRNFSYKRSTLQKQLASHYQHNEYLRD